jgi:hypothetical protein
MIIDKDKAIELMEQVVAEKGEDHVVTKCEYFNPLDGTPVCIVGHVIDRLGKGLGDMSSARRAVSMSAEGLNGVTIDSLVVDGIEFTDDAVNALRFAQEVQDNQRPLIDPNWGSAIQYAKSKTA